MSPPNSLQAAVLGYHRRNNQQDKPHPSAEGLPKVILSSQILQNAHPDRALPIRETRPSSTHRGQTLVTPTRKAAEISEQTSPTRGQTSYARGNTNLQPSSHKHRKLDKTRWQRNKLQMKEDKNPQKQLNEEEIGNLPEK